MICTGCSSETTLFKDGLCRACRMRAIKPALYPFTPAMDAKLTAIYRGAQNKPALSKALAAMATEHRMPGYILQNRAQRLKLRFCIQRVWEPEELGQLQELAGSLSLKKIARKLRRSPDSIKHKLFVLNVSAVVTVGWTQNELAQLFGVHHYKIQRWVARGWLLMWDSRVTYDSVARFVWQHMEEYRFAQADENWLKQMLRENSKPLRRAA